MPVPPDLRGMPGTDNYCISDHTGRLREAGNSDEVSRGACCRKKRKSWDKDDKVRDPCKGVAGGRGDETMPRRDRRLSGTEKPPARDPRDLRSPGCPAFGQKCGILGESVLSFCRLTDLSGEPEWI